MKRHLMIMAISSVFVFSPISSTRAEDTGTGCGLGAMIWGGSKKIVQQVLAGTTNGIFGNQTFGITSGTLGCTNDGLVKNDQKVTFFASANFENLKQDMARGEGEYLSSLAALMEVPVKSQGDFFALTQEKYPSLIPSESTTSDEMLVALNQEMSSVIR